MAKSTRQPSKFRRADNGQYTTPGFAKKNPNITVKETDTKKSPPKKKA
jgi:hypothetical protein